VSGPGEGARESPDQAGEGFGALKEVPPKTESMADAQGNPRMPSPDLQIAARIN
jgi:hypothetical protein